MNLELLHVAATGPGDLPPLLFVHGSNLAAWCWQEHFLPYFAAEGHEAYALSLRGHGGSDGADQLSSFTLADYVADVRDVMARLPAPPVLVGHSMGGAIGQLILRDHPETIAALVLLAAVPPTGLGADTTRLVVSHAADVERMRDFNTGKADTFPIGLYLSNRLPEAERGAYAARLQPESDKAGYALTGRVVRARPVPGVPVLVLGGQTDRIVSPPSVRATAKAYATEPVMFAGMSHLMMLEPDWREVAAAVLGFLRDRPALTTMRGQG
ncbi:alpha/beta fold hydrolase [Dactylosporangium sp. NPDC049525]|uniref:alpha/beta hydrolase n=1 Tax=Dactylosporangium sp. NPDC049525 TaxID=3154730 RepID=UPI0034375E31